MTRGGLRFTEEQYRAHAAKSDRFKVGHTTSGGVESRHAVGASGGAATTIGAHDADEASPPTKTKAGVAPGPLTHQRPAAIASDTAAPSPSEDVGRGSGAPALPLPTRFWEKVNKIAGGCWEWTASDNGFGYGLFKLGPKMWRAHRLSYIEAKGPIPDGLILDHLCRNKRCVNPEHLEAVTYSENGKRGDLPAINRARAAAVTRCPSGHAYDEANTHVRPNGGRVCRKCNSLRVTAHKSEQRRKYKNVPTNGYASIKESKRAFQLKLMQEAGQIRNLREQVSYLLIPKQDGERACHYVADFVYDEARCFVDAMCKGSYGGGWYNVVEDCKGMRTEVYKIKRKLMLFVHKVRIRET